MEEPVLRIVNTNEPFEVETDTSDFVIGVQLSQKDLKGRLHSVTFFSKKFNRPKRNYPIYNKELLTIVEVFKEWRLYFNRVKY